jgi:RNA polymerase sigma factor (sigma-70 family)
MANTTSESLLLQLRYAPGDETAWVRFVERYRPLIGQWCQERGLGEADVEDVCQDVLAKLVTALKNFSYDSAGRFRGWLRTVVLHALDDHFRHSRQLARGSGDSRVVEALASHEAREELIDRLAKSFDLEILERAMAAVKARVAPHNWQAFIRTVLDGSPVAETAQALGLHEGMVYVARCKIQKMLKREILRLESVQIMSTAESSPDEARRLSTAGRIATLSRSVIRHGSADG